MIHADVRDVLRYTPEHIAPLLEREDRVLRPVGERGDNHAVKQPGSAPDDVKVPEGHGIKTPGINSDTHLKTPSRHMRRMVMSRIAP